MSSVYIDVVKGTVEFTLHPTDLNGLILIQSRETYNLQETICWGQEFEIFGQGKNLENRVYLIFLQVIAFNVVFPKS